MKGRIYVTLKPGVLDPQGKAVSHALREIGYGEVADVRIGRYIEVELGGDPSKAAERLREMCAKLLANPVMEDFRVEIT
jgi:phosphoribosylformylglycinamidine synthase